MSRVTVKTGNRSSYLFIDYSFSVNESARTWTFNAALYIHIRQYDTFGPWQQIGTTTKNLTANALREISAGSAAEGKDFILYKSSSGPVETRYSKSGSYDDEGHASSFDVTWIFNVNSSWGGYSNSPSGSITVTPPDISPNYRTVTCRLSKEKINGDYETAIDVQSITVKYGESYSWTWSETGFNSVTFSGSNVTSNIVDSRNATRTLHYLDLNGYLDGGDSGWIGGYGTCNVSFNDGTAAQYGINDYYAQHRYGTTYTFNNIQEVIGHTYKGLKSGSKPLSGTITDTTDVRLSFVTNDFYAKNSGTYSPGNVYVKQNGSWVRVRRDGNNTNGFSSLCYIKQNGSWQRIDG